MTFTIQYGSLFLGMLLMLLFRTEGFKEIMGSIIDTAKAAFNWARNWFETSMETRRAATDMTLARHSLDLGDALDDAPDLEEMQRRANAAASNLRPDDDTDAPRGTSSQRNGSKAKAKDKPDPEADK